MRTALGGRGQPRSFAEAEAAFERAWSEPRHTQVTLPPVDVNRVLEEQYAPARELTVTRAMLWDLEARKARDPARYIPSVAQEGRQWAREVVGDEERLRGASRQRLWPTGEVARVLERAYLHHGQQRVVFLGAPELLDEDGRLLRGDRRQPLFHVEHAVGGAEARPLSLWRAVHLTEE